MTAFPLASLGHGREILFYVLPQGGRLFPFSFLAFNFLWHFFSRSLVIVEPFLPFLPYIAYPKTNSYTQALSYWPLHSFLATPSAHPPQTMIQTTIRAIVTHNQPLPSLLYITTSQTPTPPLPPPLRLRHTPGSPDTRGHIRLKHRLLTNVMTLMLFRGRVFSLDVNDSFPFTLEGESLFEGIY